MNGRTRAAAFVAAIALGATALASTTFAQEKKKSCFLAGGEATMITTDLAKFMANAALNNSIKGASATASGAVKMTCKDGVASVYCLAQQRACK